MEEWAVYITEARPRLCHSHWRGYSIGTRLVDEFLAKSNVSRCVDFKETANVIAKVFSLNLLLYGSD
uniref:Uncharacterized protein n=1 Tax=Leersia perrieri TaxID=77586 RepID=A0A0D9W3R1_9ORYZ